MVLYIVESSYGQYEYEYKRIEGIFDNFISAENLKGKIYEDVQMKRNLIHPLTK